MADEVSTPMRNSGSQWRAQLQMELQWRHQRSVLHSLQHRGPLRIQRALYPEGGHRAHLLILHPPGGVAGGDELDISVRVGAQAAALLTTPGAGKWYKAQSLQARQTTRLYVEPGAQLEWLPQENIHFNGSHAQIDLELDCAVDANACGWEITVLGRRASAEQFSRGCLRQSISLRRGGKEEFFEQAVVYGGDPLLSSMIGWRGLHVSALFWAVGAALNQQCLEEARERAALAVGHKEHLLYGCTQPAPGLQLMRVLGDDPESVRRLLSAVWSGLRPELMQSAPHQPRIWAT